MGGTLAASLLTAWIAVPAQASTRPVVTVPSLEIQAPDACRRGSGDHGDDRRARGSLVAGWEARVRFDSAERGVRRRLRHGPRHRALGRATRAGLDSRRHRRRRLHQQSAKLARPVDARTGASPATRHREVRRVGRRPPAGRSQRAPVALDSATQSVTVRVGTGGGRHAAPPAKRLERVRVAAHASRSRDLDGDGLVLVSDLTEASRAWDAARETGVCAPAGDVNRNGCADVSDVVRVAHAVRPRPFTLIPAADGLFVVDSTGDEPDATPGDAICQTVAGACTLRAAMTEATRHRGRRHHRVQPAGRRAADDRDLEPAADAQRYRPGRRRSTATPSPGRLRTRAPTVDNARPARAGARARARRSPTTCSSSPRPTT